MSEYGAALQAYNQEIVKCLEDLKQKRNGILDVIYKEEAEKAVLEKNIYLLQQKLDALNKRLERDKGIHEQYETTIKETELGFKKILESSQALSQLAQHQTSKLEMSTALDNTVIDNTAQSSYRLDY